MKVGVALVGVAAGFLFVGIRDPSWLWPWLWAALSFFIVGVAYFLPPRVGVKVFQKSSEGRIGIVSTILLLPYLLLVWSIWHVARLTSKVNVSDEISPGIFVGRRPYLSDLPAETSTVVDLTCEFTAARGIKIGRTYYCLPTLDHSVPDSEQFVAYVNRVAAIEGRIYIHCAAGRGRSAMFATVVLVARGLARDLDSAETMVRNARPAINISPAQRAAASFAIKTILNHRK